MYNYYCRSCFWKVHNNVDRITECTETRARCDKCGKYDYLVLDWSYKKPSYKSLQDEYRDELKKWEYNRRLREE